MTVTITRLGKAQCKLSGKVSAGVYCQFKGNPDTIFLGWAEFRKMCRFHLPEGGEATAGADDKNAKKS